MRISSFIGKMLYPRQPRWEQRRNAKHLLFAVSFALVIVVLLVFFVGLKEGGLAEQNSPLKSFLPSALSH